MTKRREHGEGTVYERETARKDGTKAVRYVAQLPINEQGKRPQLGSFKTRAEAKEALRSAAIARAQGAIVTGKVPTVRKWCDDWLERRTRISYTTRAAYRASLPIMSSYIGHIRLDRLTETDIAVMWEKLADGCRADGSPRPPLALTTLHKYHTHLKAALHAAMRSRHVPLVWNAAASEEARPQRGDRKPINPLCEVEAKELFAAAKDGSERALFILLVTTGMRHGEAQALCWEDVDLERTHISVRSSLHRETGKGLISGPTKTRKSRSVTLRPQAVAALRQHRAQQAAKRLAAGPLWEATGGSSGYVFTDELGRPLDQKRIERGFHRACERAGIARRSVKELRHAFATLALQNGVHPKVVQEAMGHSSIAITLDTYSHLVPNLQGDSLSHLDRLFG